MARGLAISLLALVLAAAVACGSKNADAGAADGGTVTVPDGGLAEDGGGLGSASNSVDFLLFFSGR